MIPSCRRGGWTQRFPQACTAIRGLLSRLLPLLLFSVVLLLCPDFSLVLLPPLIAGSPLLIFLILPASPHGIATPRVIHGFNWGVLRKAEPQTSLWTIESEPTFSVYPRGAGPRPGVRKCQSRCLLQTSRGAGLLSPATRVQTSLCVPGSLSDHPTAGPHSPPPAPRRKLYRLIFYFLAGALNSCY